MTSPRDASPTATSSSSPSATKTKAVVLFVFGTRPEAIKLCPLINVLKGETYSEKVRVDVCVTAQHRRMLDQVLSAFEVAPDYDLDQMLPGQTVTGLTARLIGGLENVFRAARPALTVVQGDTTTTFCGALASFYAHVPVAHVEAGLRTFDLRAPFPEEMNRVLTGRLSTVHFAATEWAAENLRREGVSESSIEVTGNTGIDAVLAIRNAVAAGQPSGLSIPLDREKKLIVVTAHRRESFGPGFLEICKSIDVLARRSDVQIVWPVHPNPHVQKTVDETLRGRANVELTEPLDYMPFVDLMRSAHLLITDSGGIQEEGPSLGKPILVLRDKTERPEAVNAGTVKLVGTDSRKIVREAELLLDDQNEYARMARLHNPYGDGKASERIARRIIQFLNDDVPNA
jgi:UDP-N-acetylglucosamine 2-epimerase (non-hydrolysing)